MDAATGDLRIALSSGLKSRRSHDVGHLEGFALWQKNEWVLGNSISLAGRFHSNNGVFDSYDDT